MTSSGLAFIETYDQNLLEPAPLCQQAYEQTNFLIVAAVNMAGPVVIFTSFNILFCAKVTAMFVLVKYIVRRDSSQSSFTQNLMVLLQTSYV